MSRDDVEQDMRATVGGTLTVLDRVPDEVVDLEWDLIKRACFGETLMPGRYKHLIGLAVAAVSRSRYGILFHTEAARLEGASDAEVAETLNFTRLVAGIGVMLEGLGLDDAEITEEVQRTIAFLRAKNSSG